MKHHLPGLECPECNGKLLDAHPDLQKYFLEIKKEFTDCHISWSFRNKEDQNMMYSLKKSNVKWPFSKHNSMIAGRPCARALDFFQLDQNNQAVWNPKFFFNIAQFVEKCDFKLEWAGSWKSFGETDHFQLKED